MKERAPKQDKLGCRHFNIRCEGDIVFSGVTANYFRGIRLDVITSVWCVDKRRELTRGEIEKLCAEETSGGISRKRL